MAMGSQQTKPVLQHNKINLQPKDYDAKAQIQKTYAIEQTAVKICDKPYIELTTIEIWVDWFGS
jgi:hypothetical protein